MAPRVTLKPATESQGPSEEVHEEQGEKTIEGQEEKAPERPKRYRRVRVRKIPKTGPFVWTDQLDPEESKHMKEMQAEREERLDRLRQLQKERQVRLR